MPKLSASNRKILAKRGSKFATGGAYSIPLQKLRTFTHKVVGTYTAGGDLTLKKSQRVSRNFGMTREVRIRSNPTIKGFKSGYHESVPTDVLKSLDGAKDNLDGTHTLFVTNKKSVLHTPAAGIKVDSAALRTVRKVGDTLRTDTAQTALSFNDGGAGHSGSGLSTNNQPQAHDELRRTALKCMDVKPQAGRTDRSITVALCAVAVSSIPPGTVAEAIGKIKKIKNTHALLDWEERRNAQKVKIGILYGKLTKSEQKYVNDVAGDYMARISPSKKRKLDPAMPVSPLRGTRRLGQVQGETYKPPTAAVVVKAPPSDFNEWPLYVTQDQRIERP